MFILSLLGAIPRLESKRFGYLSKFVVILSLAIVSSILSESPVSPSNHVIGTVSAKVPSSLTASFISFWGSPASLAVVECFSVDGCVFDNFSVSNVPSPSEVVSVGVLKVNRSYVGVVGVSSVVGFGFVSTFEFLSLCNVVSGEYGIESGLPIWTLSVSPSLEASAWVGNVNLSISGAPLPIGPIESLHHYV